MEIPPLGRVIKDTKFDLYQSKLIPVPVLGGKKCRIRVKGYDDDPKKEQFHTAIDHFLSIDSSVLKAAEPFIFQYYEDSKKALGAEEIPAIKRPSDVWKHVRLGSEPVVTRRAYGDKGIYVSLECGCDWEIEHGLQIIFKNGQRVNKIGPFDGHLTNSDAYAAKRLENVVYRGFGT